MTQFWAFNQVKLNRFRGTWPNWCRLKSSKLLAKALWRTSMTMSLLPSWCPSSHSTWSLASSTRPGQSLRMSLGMSLKAKGRSSRWLMNLSKLSTMNKSSFTSRNMSFKTKASKVSTALNKNHPLFLRSILHSGNEVWTCSTNRNPRTPRVGLALEAGSVGSFHLQSIILRVKIRTTNHPNPTVKI